MTDTALTPDEQARFTALYGTAPATPESDSPGLFDNALAGFAGIPSGLAGTPLSLASAATAMPSIDAGYLGSLGVDPAQFEKDAGDYFSSTWQYAVHQPIEQLRQSAADIYRPDPQTTGFVGNTLFGAADVLTRVGLGNLAAPGAGLALAAGTTGFERTQELEAQGVDSATAQASGTLTGVSLLAGGGLSAFGKTTLSRVLSGAGLNAGFGAGTRALDSSILDAHGYTAQAEQQRWSDGASIAADLIIGGAFHLLPSRGKGAPARPPAETVDAALAAKAAQGVTDSAPGVPADPKSASAHVAALDTAQAQLMDGQPVAVDALVREATFAPRPEPAEPVATRTLPEVGAIIDGRLAALDELAQGARSPDEMAALGKEAGELEDLLREQYRARDQGVRQSANTGLTPDEMTFAEGRLADVRGQMEQHRQALAAGNDAARLRERLANIDDDAALRALADKLHPEPRRPLQADTLVREALVEAGVPEEALHRLDEPVPGPVVESADALASPPPPAEPAARSIGERVRDLLGRSKADADRQAGAGAIGADGAARAAQPRDSAADGAADAGTRLDPARDGDVALARQIVAQAPDLVLDDGTTAADALRAADLDVQEAQRHAEGIGAAVACFLRFGAEA